MSLETRFSKRIPYSVAPLIQRRLTQTCGSSIVLPPVQPPPAAPRSPCNVCTASKLTGQSEQPPLPLWPQSGRCAPPQTMHLSRQRLHLLVLLLPQSALSAAQPSSGSPAAMQDVGALMWPQDSAPGVCTAVPATQHAAGLVDELQALTELWQSLQMQHTSDSQSGSSVFLSQQHTFAAANDTPLATAVLGWQHASALTSSLDSCSHSRHLCAQLCSGRHPAALCALLSALLFCTHLQLHLAQLGLDLIYLCRRGLGGHGACSSNNHYRQRPKRNAFITEWQSLGDPSAYSRSKRLGKALSAEARTGAATLHTSQAES